MAISLEYGNYKFPIPPMVTITRRPAQAMRNPQAYLETWQIRGDLYDASGQNLTAILAMRAAMETAFSSQSNLTWKDASTGEVVDALLVDRAIGGLTILIDFPDDPVAYATHCPFRIEVSGEFRREHLDDAPGSATPADSAMIFGEYTVSESKEGNELVLSISGMLRGPTEAALRAKIDSIAAATVTGGVSLRKQVNFLFDADSIFRNQAQFVIEIADVANSPDVFEVEESIEIRNAMQLTIPRILLGDRDPVFQQGSRLPTIVVQHGSAVGRTGYPSTLLYAVKRVLLPDIEQPVIVRDAPVPRPDGSGYTNYRLSWRFVMAGTAAIDINTISPLVAPLNEGGS